ncbi:hypothetical protein Aperf_G00000120730 [Anoplocephala perfoliata]
MSLALRLLTSSKLLSPLNLTKMNSLRFFRTSVANGVEDIYKVLGVKHNATQSEIKEAFYNLSKKHHPDITGNAASSAKFQEILSAYEILGDPNKRADYDRGLVIPRSSVPATEFPSKDDLNILKTFDSGSFEKNYARAYNRNLQNAWALRADENISKSAFDYRIDQRNFANVLYAVIFGLMLSSFGIAKYYEKPIPLTSSTES